MTPINIRTFEPADAPRMEDLQERCIERTGDMSVLPAGFYWAPGFENGKNIFIATHDDGRHAGHVAVYQTGQVSQALDGARVLWMDLRVDPENPDGLALQEKLLEKALQRAGQIKKNLKAEQAVLSSTFFARGQSSIAFLKAHGFRAYEIGYSLRRSLKEPLPAVPAPEGVQVRAWRMETPQDQETYLKAYQSVFREASAWTADSLRHFMTSGLWAAGTTFSAFAGDKLVGSVMAYYNPDSPEKLGVTEHVFVLPKWRGKNVAQAMLSEALAFLKKHKQQAAELQVGGQNRRAIAIYEKLGYQVFQEEISLARSV